jgi:hypothetical protein
MDWHELKTERRVQPWYSLTDGQLPSSRDDVNHSGANGRVTASSGTSKLRFVKPADGKIYNGFITAPKTRY